MVGVEQVIEHYKHVAGVHLKRILHRPAPTVPEDRVVAEDFLRWAAKNDIDPLYWITEYIAWAARTKSKVPAFRALRADNAIAAHRIHERAWREQCESRRAAASMLSREVQRIVDLSLFVSSQEDVRKRYLRVERRPEMCRVSWEYSGGFDPRSKYCPQCPQAIGCSQAMNERYQFNVVALRLRNFDQLPAAVARIAREYVGRLPLR